MNMMIHNFLPNPFKYQVRAREGLRKTWQVLKVSPYKSNLRLVAKRILRKKEKEEAQGISFPAEPLIAATSKPAVETNDEPANEGSSVNPDSTQVRTRTPDDPKDTNLGQLEHTRDEEISPSVKEVEDSGVPTQVILSTTNETSLSKAFAEVDPRILADSSNAKEVEPSAQTQVDPPVEINAATEVNPDPPSIEEPIIESPKPLNENDTVVTKVGEDDEENLSNKGEHSSTKDHHQSKSGDEEEAYDATDDFLNSSEGYARTIRTGDSLEDDGTSASKPVSDFYLPPHVLQSVKSLATEDVLDKLLNTYGRDIPIAEDQKQELERERESLELHFRKDIIEGNMLSHIDRDPTLYFNLKSLFHKLQTHSISEALSFQVTQAENFLDQYARNLQNFNRISIELDDRISTHTKYFDLASQENAEVNKMKVASTSSFLRISACEDNIARWKLEIRELEEKIAQEEKNKKLLEEKAVEVPKTVIEERARVENPRDIVSTKKETNSSSVSTRKKTQPSSSKTKTNPPSKRIPTRSQRHVQEQEDSGSDEIDSDWAEFLKTYVPEEYLCDSDHEGSLITVEGSTKSTHVEEKKPKASSSKKK
ncbi:hypothetical protein TSUD_415220 [Trifolium subterraneum]|uniref:Uncharacterized protein n=1 Tax=Trifolium subterraneum TaxID=3900 RepID=A0A2Z6P7A0_TRISU|nr:hypothetical protein TSUD_415220 [Trifolium subterraneum]